MIKIQLLFLISIFIDGNVLNAFNYKLIDLFSVTSYQLPINRLSNQLMIRNLRNFLIFISKQNLEQNSVGISDQLELT